MGKEKPMNNKLIEEVERQKIFLRGMRSNLILTIEDRIAREIERLNLLELRIEKEALTGGQPTYRLDDVPKTAPSVFPAPPLAVDGPIDLKPE